MEKNQLLAAIEQHEADSETYGNLQEDRTEALDYYLGKPLGNEVEGRSQVVYRSVWDTVEWIKPQICDIFTTGNEIAQFAPMSANDVKAAEQESDYVSHVIQNKNAWFEVFYAWCHDALVQKNGYVKVFWDDSEDLTSEKYQGLTADELALLQQDDSIVITDMVEDVVVDMATGMASTAYTVKLERKKPRNQVKIINLAPENVRVDQNARTLNLQDDRVAFVQNAEYKTISELREEGFDVDDDLNDSGDGVGDWEEDLRDDYSPFRDRVGNEADPSMRRVKVRETWIRYDEDGDGRAELRHVIVVGKTILHNEECDCIPIVSLCPTPLAHRHYGLSVADAVMDLQRIQTALLRGSLDNQYLQNNGRYGVDVNNVNLDDMLDSRPGGIVRVEGAPSASIFPLTHPTSGQNVIPMMEYVERLAQKRTGVNEQTQGLDPNALNKTATGAQIMMSAAQQRIKFIARIFGETGVKSLFLLVHKLTLTHGRQAEMVQIRGEWIPVDPRQWVKRQDLVIQTDYGTGDRAEKMAFLMQALGLQKEALMINATTPKNIYNTLSKLTRVAGFKDASEFWTDPSTVPPKPPQPDPKIMVEQMRQQSDVQKFQAEQMLAQAKLEADREKARLELELQASNDARDAEREAIKAQMNAELERYKQESQQAIEAARLETQKQLELLKQQAENERTQYKTDKDNETKLIIAQMGTREAVAGKLTEQKDQFAGEIEGSLTGKLNDMLMRVIDERSRQFGEAINNIAGAINSPRKLVRDADGKAIGVEINGIVREIERDENGRAIGLR